jgi:peptidoglycan/LPS O-acetylase OafA/YrhL
LAALAVVFSHYGQFYWTKHAIALAIVGVAASPFAPGEHWIKSLAQLPFDFGAFGVALFFLVSGYLIPAAVRRAHGGFFLLRRLLRIWPVWAAGLACSLLVHYTMSGGGAYDFERIAVNLLLVRDLVGGRLIDPVVWSLEVEVKYYLLAALIGAVCHYSEAAMLRTTTALSVLLITLVPALAMWPLHPGRQESATIHLYSFATIFLGTALRTIRDSAPRRREAGILATTAIALFAATQSGLVNEAARWTAIPSYALALAVFAGTVLYRPATIAGTGRTGRLLDWLADRSYPLYAVHVVSGFAVITLIGRHTGIPELGLPIALIVAMLLASFLHRHVELPAQRFGKFLQTRHHG